MSGRTAPRPRRPPVSGPDPVGWILVVACLGGIARDRNQVDWLFPQGVAALPVG
ncbi:hypothetical protein OG218_07055 [Kineococcus sp. NBC_00420]|uniref:hypothetical protein n=1 Tax=Kineococcus sp. NBC_00420 TaxID=2903564 RepID=UPI002E1D24C5